MQFFNTHKLNEHGVEKLNKFRAEMEIVTNEVVQDMPNGREKSIFLTKMEESVMWGTKAICSKEWLQESTIAPALDHGQATEG